MTHDEAIGVIMQAVHAATAGDNQPLHHLASLLVAQEQHEEDAPVALAELPESSVLTGFAAPLPGEQEFGEERR